MNQVHNIHASIPSSVPARVDQPAFKTCTLKVVEFINRHPLWVSFAFGVCVFFAFAGVETVIAPSSPTSTVAKNAGIAAASGVVFCYSSLRIIRAIEKKCFPEPQVQSQEECFQAIQNARVDLSQASEENHLQIVEKIVAFATTYPIFEDPDNEFLPGLLELISETLLSACDKGYMPSIHRILAFIEGKPGIIDKLRNNREAIEIWNIHIIHDEKQGNQLAAKALRDFAERHELLLQCKM